MSPEEERRRLLEMEAGLLRKDIVASLASRLGLGYLGFRV